MIYIIEDNEIMAELLARYCAPHEVKIFHNAVDAIMNLDEDMPSLIFLDVLLTGPDGFTFLNEINSYPNVPNVVLVTSLNLKTDNLEDYNVKQIINKDTMLPEDVKNTIKKWCKDTKSDQNIAHAQNFVRTQNLAHAQNSTHTQDLEVIATGVMHVH